MENQSMTAPTYSRSDFQTDQEVRWCPGCGDYTILAAVQGFMANMGVPGRRSSSSPGSAAPPASPTT